MRLPPPGNAGILRVPDTGSLQQLLPPGCRGLLLSAHRDQRPRTTGVQPPGVGPGDGRPRGARHRRPQVELWLSGVETDGGLSWSLRLQSTGSWWSPAGVLTVTAVTKNSPKRATWTLVAHLHRDTPGDGAAFAPGVLCVRVWRFVTNLWIYMGKLPHGECLATPVAKQTPSRVSRSRRW